MRLKRGRFPFLGGRLGQKEGVSLPEGDLKCIDASVAQVEMTANLSPGFLCPLPERSAGGI